MLLSSMSLPSSKGIATIKQTIIILYGMQCEIIRGSTKEIQPAWPWSNSEIRQPKKYLLLLLLSLFESEI